MFPPPFFPAPRQGQGKFKSEKKLFNVGAKFKMLVLIMQLVIFPTL